MLRNFARRTNLLLAGRRFVVHGSDELGDALRSMLLHMGAREIDSASRGTVDYIVVVGGGRAELAAAVERTVVGERPLILLDARDAPLGSATPSLSEVLGLTGGSIARPGVHEFTLDGRELCIVDSAAYEAGNSGAARLAWARRFMAVSRGFADDLRADGAADGIRIGLSMVLEPKTAVLALLLREAGAVVTVFAHSDDTDDEAADALRDLGLEVFASSAADRAEQHTNALKFFSRGFDLLLDDGSSLIRLAHLEAPDLVTSMIGAAEETTSGLRPLRVMQSQGALRIPVIAVNDAHTKTDFDNLYGTGQSCVFAILDLLDPLGGIDMTDTRVAVAGFGPVGQGVARHCVALGARVVISETDPVRALQAAFAGYDVQRLIDSAPHVDLVISATGISGTIGLDILEACGPDTVIAVAGGVHQEIAIDASIAAGATRETIAHKVERFTLAGGGRVLILDDGGCINITAGEGNPIEIMDLSFGVQLQAVALLLERGRELEPGVHRLPDDADALVARRALATVGLAVDEASEVQRESLSTWMPPRFSGSAPA